MLNFIRLLLLVAASVFIATSANAKRVALVIGNDNYIAATKLFKARNDADAMARELRAAGFSVQLHKDLNYREMVNTYESIKSFNLERVIKYATYFPGGFYSSAFGFFMNEDKWNKLSKQDQDAILSVSGEALARMAGKAWDAADKVSIDSMKAAGVAVVDANPAFMADVRKRSEPLINDWIKAANAKGVNGAKVFAEFHEELKNVADGR